MAAWFAADGTQLGTGQLTPSSTRRHARRVPVPRHALPGRQRGRRRHAGLREDLGAQRRRRPLDAKKWVGNGGTTSPGGFIQDFNTHYVTPRESYAKMRELANEFPNVSKLMNLPNKTNGYQRKAQTILGMAAAVRGRHRRRRPPTSRRPSC